MYDVASGDYNMKNLKKTGFKEKPLVRASKNVEALLLSPEKKKHRKGIEDAKLIVGTLIWLQENEKNYFEKSKHNLNPLVHEAVLAKLLSFILEDSGSFQEAGLSLLSNLVTLHDTVGKTLIDKEALSGIVKIYNGHDSSTIRVLVLQILGNISLKSVETTNIVLENTPDIPLSKIVKEGCVLIVKNMVWMIKCLCRVPPRATKQTSLILKTLVKVPKKYYGKDAKIFGEALLCLNDISSGSDALVGQMVKSDLISFLTERVMPSCQKDTLHLTLHIIANALIGNGAQMQIFLTTEFYKSLGKVMQFLMSEGEDMSISSWFVYVLLVTDSSQIDQLYYSKTPFYLLKSAKSRNVDVQCLRALAITVISGSAEQNKALAHLGLVELFCRSMLTVTDASIQLEILKSLSMILDLGREFVRRYVDCKGWGDSLTQLQSSENIGVSLQAKKVYANFEFTLFADEETDDFFYSEHRFGQEG